MDKTACYGASVERGVVIDITDDGYVVRSADRDQVTTLPMKSLKDSHYTVGDAVYFFMFDDGNGMIVASV